MAKLSIQPKVGKFVAVHPATGLDVFEDAEGKEIQGIFSIVGFNSQEFYDFINDDKDGLDDRDTTAVMLSTLITGWEDTGFCDVEYSPEAALEILEDPNNIWLRHQLREFIEDQSHFF